ncbi:MAG: invasion associated locus B family protein [Dongiaceae bacterium]
MATKMTSKTTVIASCLLIAGLAFVAPAYAESATPIGDFGNWQALTFKEGDNTGCYVLSKPDRMEGAYKSRGEVYALVTHRPADATRDVVTIIAGYSFKPKSEVTVQISAEKFQLFTDEGMAWAPDADSDRALVNAMKNGSSMVVYGMSARGTKTTDTYSLTGFTKAYKAIGDACGLDQ